MRILLTSVTNKPPEVLNEHLSSVRALRLPPHVQLDYLYMVDPSITSASRAALVEHEMPTCEALPKPEAARDASGDWTHEWNQEAFDWLGACKEHLLNVARDARYDAIFFVDSDLVLGPETLESLIYAKKDIVSAVFWTRWTPEMPELPQVWLEHPYELAGRGMSQEEFLRRLSFGELVRVGGLGACTLIRAKALAKVSFARVPGLPTHGMWQGEDRHFCINAEAAHLELWADAWPGVHHLYRSEDLGEPLEAFKRYINAEPREVDVGVWVSFVLEPLEDPNVAQERFHVRGRLGQLKLLPEIEHVLKEMERGTKRIVPIEFPSWWPLPHYRGKTKNVLVRLLDVK